MRLSDHSSEHVRHRSHNPPTPNMCISYVSRAIRHGRSPHPSDQRIIGDPHTVAKAGVQEVGRGSGFLYSALGLYLIEEEGVGGRYYLMDGDGLL